MTDSFFCIREEKTESEQISLPGIGSRQPSEKKMLTRLSARRQKTPLTKFRLENGLPCLAFLGWRPRRHLPPIKFQTMTPTNLNMRHERSRKSSGEPRCGHMGISKSDWRITRDLLLLATCRSWEVEKGGWGENSATRGKNAGNGSTGKWAEPNDCPFLRPRHRSRGSFRQTPVITPVGGNDWTFRGKKGAWNTYFQTQRVKGGDKRPRLKQKREKQPAKMWLLRGFKERQANSSMEVFVHGEFHS